MIVIKIPTTKTEFKEYYSVRYQILREPWGQPHGTEKDDYEPISQHYMAVDDKTGKVVGVVKIFEKAPGVAHISHLAVDSNYRKQGIGRLLMKTVEDYARQKGYDTVGCNARLDTTVYFEKLGYRISALPAPYFSTIQVVWMEKKL